MKTYNLIPLISMVILIGMLLGVGLFLSLMSGSLLSIGGGMLFVAFLLAIVVDKVHRGCRLIEHKA